MNQPEIERLAEEYRKQVEDEAKKYSMRDTFIEGAVFMQTLYTATAEDKGVGIDWDAMEKDFKNHFDLKIIAEDGMFSWFRSRPEFQLRQK